MQDEASFDWDEPGDILDGTLFPVDLLSDVLEDDVNPGQAGGKAAPNSGTTPSAASSAAPLLGEPTRAATSACASTKRGSEFESNSAACRRYRNRRRAEALELRARNVELEQARHAYLSRIAELQMELQTARACGGVDLAKENELLRAEIRKHKAFLHNIVAVTQSVPTVLPEEQARLLRAGMDSGVGQVVGLLYTSSTWRRTPSFEVAPGHRAHALFQLLPEGATVATAKRVNLRVDFGVLPCAAKALDGYIWRQCTDVQNLNAMQERSPALAGSSVRAWHEPVAPALTAKLAADLGLDMCILRYHEGTTSAKPDMAAKTVAKETVHAMSRAVRELSPRSFLFAPYSGASAHVGGDVGASASSAPEASDDTAAAAAATAKLDAELEIGPATCSVMCVASCAKSLAGADILPAPQSEAQQLAASMIKGQVIVPHASDAQQCYMASVMSLPLGFFLGFGNAFDLVDDQGKLSALTQAIFAETWRAIVEPCFARSAQQ